MSNSSEALDKAREAVQAMKERGEKPVRLDPLEKARKNPKSLRAAVNAKCWECVGAGWDPGPRRAIRECTITKCPLWPVRPYQKASKEDDE